MIFSASFREMWRAIIAAIFSFSVLGSASASDDEAKKIRVSHLSFLDVNSRTTLTSVEAEPLNAVVLDALRTLAKSDFGFVALDTQTGFPSDELKALFSDIMHQPFLSLGDKRRKIQEKVFNPANIDFALSGRVRRIDDSRILVQPFLFGAELWEGRTLTFASSDYMCENQSRPVICREAAREITDGIIELFQEAENDGHLTYSRAAAFCADEGGTGSRVREPTTPLPDRGGAKWYFSSISFQSLPTRRPIASDDAERLDPVVQSALRGLAEAVECFFFNAPGHRVPRDDKTRSKFSAIYWNPNLSRDQKMIKLHKKFVKTNRVDAVVTGQVTRDSAGVTVRPIILGEGFTTLSLKFEEAEFDCVESQRPIVCPQAARAIKGAVDEIVRHYVRSRIKEREMERHIRSLIKEQEKYLSKEQEK
jgi:hypothetical protein